MLCENQRRTSLERYSFRRRHESAREFQKLGKGTARILEDEESDERRSPGMMIEDQGQKVEAQNKLFQEGKKNLSAGKLEKVQTGNYIAYAVAGKQKERTVGKIIALSKAEANVVVALPLGPRATHRGSSGEALGPAQTGGRMLCCTEFD